MAEHATQKTERWQVDTTAAEVYEEMFVPALFRDAAAELVARAAVGAGDRVLDVGCGTGIVARLAADRVAPTGTVAGLDLNEGMLAVAGRIAPDVEWRHGDAANLPFPDAAFDVVVSQFALMFFTDRELAIREMVRVARPGGRILVSVWDTVDRNPDFAVLSGLAESHFGEQVAAVLRAPFSLGDLDALLPTFRRAGSAAPVARTTLHSARFPSVRSWLYMEAKGSPIGAMLDDKELDAFLDQLEPRFAHLTQDDGSAQLALSAHVITVRA
jgi:ubiquinone/menaquinone biosynthesis C-methylase UbiE